VSTFTPQTTGEEILIVLFSLLRGDPGGFLSIGNDFEGEPAGEEEKSEDIG